MRQREAWAQAAALCWVIAQSHSKKKIPFDTFNPFTKEKAGGGSGSQPLSGVVAGMKQAASKLPPVLSTEELEWRWERFKEKQDAGRE